jgi:methyltransferase (TIGR00027 family)
MLLTTRRWDASWSAEGLRPPSSSGSFDRDNLFQPARGRQASLKEAAVSSSESSARVLPDHPTLEHQRKRARALLREWRARDPHAALHDAQRVIAGEYGFASWTEMKRHIGVRQSLSPLNSVSLVVAAQRALETELEQPLFRDPLARPLAGEAGFALEAMLRSTSWPGFGRGPEPYVSIRTRYFDDALVSAVRDHALTQVAIVAAGMDTRAFRLDWPSGISLFEIDAGEVFARKECVLHAVDARPRCERRIVKTDPTRSFAASLIKAGFDPSHPAAFLVERSLVYFDANDVSRLFRRLTRLAAPGSWLGCEFTSAATLTSPFMKPLFDRLARLGRPPWIFGIEDPEAWLDAYGWMGSSVVPGSPDANYGRWPYGYIPRGIPGVPRAFLSVARLRLRTETPPRY